MRVQRQPLSAPTNTKYPLIGTGSIMHIAYAYNIYIYIYILLISTVSTCARMYKNVICHYAC